MLNGYEREFVYTYGAVSPREGDFDWKICPQMNTQRMSEFLEQVGQRYPRDFIVMIVDGASSHRGKDLVAPENIRLLSLPAYSPELNPVEHLWDDLREKSFHNRVFESIDALEHHLCDSLRNLELDHQRVRSIVAWPWIIDSLLN